VTVKILQITKKPPFPRHDGESWAVTSLAQGLKASGAEVHLLTLCPMGYDAVQFRNRTDHIYESVKTVEADLAIKRFPALLNLPTSKSIHVSRYKKAVRVLSKGEMRDQLTRQSFDLILCETVYSYIIAEELALDVPKVIRAHNLEHQIWAQYAETSPWPKSQYFSNQAQRLKLFELEAIGKSESVLWLSDYDQSIYEHLAGNSEFSYFLPIGVELASYQKAELVHEPILLGFLGSLDWRPNVEGLNYFLKDIWPTALVEHDNLRLLIAGKNPSKELEIKQGQDVAIFGEVEHSDEFLSQLHAMIVPLRSGSGTRVKILEALSLGIPVLTTSKGCEGLDLKHKEHVLIADSPAQWVDAIRLIKNEEMVRLLRSNGLIYIEQNHNINSLGKKAFDILSSIF